MNTTVNAAIETAVGVACLVAAFDVLRRPRLRLVAALLALAGVAAVAHAAVSLT